jgi:phosphoribosylformimino-5-aminoimidazole carboxamide ribotide isomerase
VDLYPAIDLRGGRCVRLRQGDFARETVYDADPVEVARGYEAAGARWVHVVDLDAARVQGSNRDTVVAIAAAVGVRVQTGGGVRDGSLLDAGLARVVLGSAAVADPGLVRRLGEAHPGGVAVGLDHWGGEVKVRGWEQGSGRRLLDLVEELQGPHVAAFVVTDIAVDGVGTGPDLAGYRDLLRATPVPVVASGGVGSLDHLRALRDLEVGGRRLEGVIVGRALYEGAFTVEEALAALSGGTTSGMEEEREESVIDRMRDSGAGTEDPNIVGDVGPVDIPPGSDGDALIEEADPDDDKPIEV